MTSWLIDNSAYVRMQSGQAVRREEWNARIERGLVRLATVTRLELGFSAWSGRVGREAFGLPPLSLMPIEHLTPAMEDRAFEVQRLRVDRGLRRAPDLPIAATAEKTRAVSLVIEVAFSWVGSRRTLAVAPEDGRREEIDVAKNVFTSLGSLGGARIRV